MPSATAIANAHDLPTGLVSGALSVAEHLAGPVGMALGAANTIGNIANTISNGSMLASIGAPLSFGAMFAGASRRQRLLGHANRNR